MTDCLTTIGYDIPPRRVPLFSRFALQQSDYDVCVECGSLAQCPHDQDNTSTNWEMNAKRSGQRTRLVDSMPDDLIIAGNIAHDVVDQQSS